MSAKRIWLVDGVEIEGTEEAGKAVGLRRGSFQNLAFLNEKEHGRGCVFMVKGHTVQGKGRVNGSAENDPINEIPKKEILGARINMTVISETAIISPQELLALELRAVKEQLRYLRECLIGRLHSVDEIAATMRSIEMRVIKDEAKVRGVYHEANGHQSEKLG
jgi:hypothetical protein